MGALADPAADADGAPLSRLAFGSCRKTTSPQHIWRAIAADRPDVWLWTGDAVYTPRPAGRRELLQAYERVGADSDEARALSVVREVEGVYDDHDYGPNDAGRHFEHRELSRSLFLDRVVRAPPDSPTSSVPRPSERAASRRNASPERNFSPTGRAGPNEGRA